MAVFILLIGWYGFYELRGPDDLAGYLRVTYEATQLFVFAGDSELIGVSPALTAASVLAPFIGFSVALSVTRALWIDRLDAWRARRMRDHIVVVGLGTTGRALSRGFRAAGERVVAVEIDSKSPGVAQARSAGARVVSGDAADSHVLRSARIHRARSIYVFPGRDEVALQCLNAVRTVNCERTDCSLRATVNIEDSELRTQLQKHEVRTGDQLLDVLYVSVAHIAADIALRAALPFLAAKQVIAIGDAAFTDAMLRLVHEHSLAGVDIGGLAIFDDDLDGSSVSDMTPRPLSDVAVARSLRDLEGIGDDAALRDALSAAVTSSQPDTILISFGDNVLTRRWALKLAGAFGGARPELVAVLREASATDVDCAEADCKSDMTQAVKTIDMTSMLLAGEYTPPQSWAEALARAMHERYLSQALSEGWDSAAAVPWEKLQEHYRDANRAQARGLPVVLKSIGCVLEASDQPEDPFIPDPKELEVLSSAEHERWIAERKRNWRSLDPTQRAKAERLLVPYSSLPQNEQDKDREAILRLLELVAVLGYRVRRPRSTQTQAH